MSASHLYEFGPFRLDFAGRLLFRSNDLVPLPPKTLDVLVVLVDKRGIVVPREQLMSAVWPDTFVEESNLGHHVSLLRKTLGNGDNDEPYIETIPKRGYRFTGAVQLAGKPDQPFPARENASPVSPPPTGVLPSYSRVRSLTIGGLLALLTLFVAIGLVSPLIHSSADQSSGELVLTRLTSTSGFATDPVVFSSGKLLAFASDSNGEGNLDIWVQHIGSGPPVRITMGPEDERWPTFSPDGARIAFHTERNGGELDVIPVVGGEPKTIATGGQRPRFSPDGNWITYWMGSVRTNLGQRSSQKIFIVPAAGGISKQIHPEFLTARYPVWSPDGKYLLFAGWRDGNGPAEENFDWWVTPLDGGPAVKTGAAAVLRRAGLSPYPIPGVWAGNKIVLSAQLGDSISLWQVDIAAGTWQISNAPTRLTTTTGLDVEPFVTDDGELVYASQTENIDVWSLPLDANRGEATGGLKQLTRNLASDMGSSVAFDGDKLVFISNRTGNNDLWFKNLVTGAEAPLTSSANVSYARISRDGSRAAYTIETSLYAMTVGSDGQPGVAAKLCGNCAGMSESLNELTPDGKGVLLSISKPPGSSLVLFDLSSGQQHEIITDASHLLNRASFSPDGRWIAFNSLIGAGQGNKGFVAPVKGAALIAPEEWIPTIVSGTVPRWSPDGNRLYFIQVEGGWRCIWTQKLDPLTKRPIGAPEPVFHLHDSRYAIPQYPAFAFSVGRDKVVFPLRELTGNIWIARRQSPRQEHTQSRLAH